MQVGQGQVELRDVEDLAARLVRALLPHDRGEAAGVPHRLAAVEGHRRHGAARGAVDQQAGAAEPLELLDLRQQHSPGRGRCRGRPARGRRAPARSGRRRPGGRGGRGARRRSPSPRPPAARPGSRRPGRGAAPGRPPPPAGHPRSPRRGEDAAPDRSVDQQGQPDAPVDVERGRQERAPGRRRRRRPAPGRPSIVVERAYTVHSLVVLGRRPGDAAGRTACSGRPVSARSHPGTLLDSDG